jgi:glycosyltransferase involved in cell wall biosynthesis
VSAVIPVHDGADYVGAAIRSVVSQTFPVLECIVVNDGSTDGTSDVLASFGDDIVVITQAQSGVSAARNRGAEQARGDLIAFLDHDDEWVPTKLERQLSALAPTDMMVLCALQVVAADGEPLEVKHLGPAERLVQGMLLFDGTPYLSCSSSCVVRRDAFLAMEGFDRSLSMSADWDFLMRVLLEGGLSYIDEPLVRYRVHDSNMSRHVDLMERDMIRAFRKAFAHPNLPPQIRNRRAEAYGRLYRMLAGSYEDVGERRRALQAALKAMRHRPGLLRDFLIAYGGRALGRSRHSV